jgi:hypothetical protein
MSIHKLLHIAVIFFLFINGCVVTDEIDFDEKINYSPQLVEATPAPDKINYSKANVTQKFTVIVQDPDKQDFKYYDGRISLVETLNSSIINVETFSCNEPEVLDEEKNTEYIKLSITCQLSLRPSSDNIDLLQVKVNISDRGYLAGNTLPSDARTLEVIWTYELVN